MTAQPAGTPVAGDVPAAVLPRGLLLAVLLWWGWQCDLLAWGVAAGLVLEGARQLQVHWDLRPDDFRRLWNVTILLFAGAGLYLFFAQEGWEAPAELLRNPTRRLAAMTSATQAMRTFVQWLPLLFLPFMLAHTCSRQGLLPWSTVSVLARRVRPWPGVNAAHPGFHPAPPFLLVVLFAASASEQRPHLYLPALVLWTAWVLWPQRSRRFSPFSWLACLALAAGLAFGGQLALVLVHRRIQEMEARLLNRLGEGSFDPLSATTEIGSLRRRKVSGRIVLRVYPQASQAPALLREAAFNHFKSPRWLATHREFQPVVPVSEADTWRLRGVAGLRQPVVVERYSRSGYTPLALPEDVAELRDLVASSVETNRLASARAQGLLPLASYTVWRAASGGFEGEPDADDLDLGGLALADRQAVLQVVAQLGLQGADRATVLRRTEEFFLRNFSYSLTGGPVVRTGDVTTTALSEFLLRVRRGHCEYFATATTLILRAAGVPARYVVGWSVQEAGGAGFVVRERHAHAWCSAYVNGRWQPVDNTPGGWASREAQDRSILEPVYDQLAAAWRWFTRFRQGDSRWRLYVFVAGLGVLCFMGWRELRGGRWRRTGRTGRQSRLAPVPGPGADSEFYAVLARLERQHAARPPGSPLGPWLAQLPLNGRQAEVEALLRLHYQLRFDPAGLDPAARQILRERSRALAAARWERTGTRG